MKNHSVHWKCGLLLPALIAFSASPSHGQTKVEEIRQIEEVVVTARKKSESLQDVPISITAFTGSDVLEMGLSDTLSIDEKTPNLEIKTFGGQPNIFIRGVGNNDFNATTVSPVSRYVDEVVMGLTGSQTAQLFDVQRATFSIILAAFVSELGDMPQVRRLLPAPLGLPNEYDYNPQLICIAAATGNCVDSGFV